MIRLIRKLIFVDTTEDEKGLPSRYRRMWLNTVLAVAAVGVIPLLLVTGINYYLYQQSFKKEITQPIRRITAITKHSLESFLEERIAAAKYVVSREQPKDLFDEAKLKGIFKRMRNSFGGLVDIGVLDSEGVMRTYTGPYDLKGKNYRNQDWFNKSLARDLYVSDVFLGHRQLPHFIIAVKRDEGMGKPLIFRATIDIEGIVKRIHVAGLKRNSDAFLVNKDGLLQTPSSLFGKTLDKFNGYIPPYSQESELYENITLNKKKYLMGVAYIENSSFIYLILVDQEKIMDTWFTYQGEMLIIFFVSIIILIVLIMRITTIWVSRIKEADLRREATLHNAEHTNRMASIGRLAAGVAHEINNPLAIINEKAGLITDIMKISPDLPNKEKLLSQTDKIIQSVNRCSDITHRLLGFARHMDIKYEPVDIPNLIQEVLSFLEKEASYRDISVDINVTKNIPTIQSDKGQLQQLFLNLINNSFDAMEVGGHLQITIASALSNKISISITDDGKGIPKKNMERIFEPFYTTKKAKGTGLGLSITYGIVQKLGGRISVDSEVGKGTTFVVTLPISLP